MFLIVFIQKSSFISVGLTNHEILNQALAFPHPRLLLLQAWKAIVREEDIVNFSFWLSSSTCHRFLMAVGCGSVLGHADEGIKE